MNSESTISPAQFERLRALDTCTASNAIERLKVRLRNEGFIAGAVRCRFPGFAPMLGYALTGRIRSSVPPMTGRCYYDRIDFWRLLDSMRGPKVMVLQDIDPRPGFGALVGEIHASIAMAMNCVGYVTNGSVRDLPGVRRLGFHLFSGSVAVSHAYAHIVDFGKPVEIGGLKISTGDLLHGDLHGVHKIPLEIANQVPDEAEKLLCEEDGLKKFCRSEQFSVDALDERLREAAADSL